MTPDSEQGVRRYTLQYFDYEGYHCVAPWDDKAFPYEPNHKVDVVLAHAHDAVVDEMLVSIGKQADRANKAEAAIAERDERIAELTEIALARADALAERDKYFEQVKMLDKKVHNQREEINRLIAERDRRIAELEAEVRGLREVLGRRGKSHAPLLAMKAERDALQRDAARYRELRRDYGHRYDGLGIYKPTENGFRYYVEEQADAAIDAQLAPVGGASDDMAAHNGESGK